MSDTQAVAAVRVWLREHIVGLDLCPFAGGPLRAGRVRIARCNDHDLESAATAVLNEVQRLVDDPAIETTLLLVPQVGADFEDFLDATELVQQVMTASGYEGVFQLVPFHPDFRFAEGPDDDPAHGVQRSPTPLWHLLREESLDRAIDGHPDVGSIPQRNAALLRQRAGWTAAPDDAGQS